MISAQFIRFLLAGAAAAIVNVGSRIAFSMFMPYVPAIMLAFCIGVSTAFLLNKRFVFDSTGNSAANQMIWFLIVNLAAVAQTVLISVFLARFLFPRAGMSFHPETVAHAIGVIVPVITSYLGHKHISFRVPK